MCIRDSLLSFEDVTLYPTADNTVTMLFYGNNHITYAKDEIASLRQTSGSVSLESGKMNKAWSRLSSDKWQPKVYIYPVSYTHLDVYKRQPLLST